jgi:hypothetical protein
MSISQFIADANRAVGIADPATGFRPAPMSPPTPEGLSVAVGGDPVEIGVLPPAAQEKLRKISDQAADVYAATVPLRAERDELHRDWQKAQQRVSEVLAAVRYHPGDPEANPSVVEARRKAEIGKSEYERVVRRIDEKTEAWKPLRQIAHIVENYVQRTLPGYAVEMAEPVEVRLARGESIQNALGSTRERIEALRADLQSVEDAPQPSHVAKARIREQVDALAAEGRPSVWPVIESSTGRIGWPQGVPTHAKVGGELLSLPSGHDSLALVAWLHRDSLIAALEREVDAKADDASALTDDERTERRAAAAAALLAEERLEEALIVAIEGKGLPALRRVDADPRAILGLSDSAPEPKRRRA